MDLAATIALYGGGPGSGRHSTGRKEKPPSNKHLVYHWTDKEGLEGILNSGQWDGGSATRNPAYRFSKGVPKETRFALIFDSSKGGFKDRKDQTVPWEEWEVLHDESVDLFDYPKGKFLGFGARDAKSAAVIRNTMKKIYGEPLWDVHRVTPKGLR